MNKILFINIDKNYRSVYLASLAASMLKAQPASKFTLVTSTGSETLETTDIFESIHVFDTEDFFLKSKSYSNDKIEREVKLFLAPMINTHWDVVVNFSSNLIGSMLTHFLRSKKFLGPYLSQDTQNVEHSSFSSYLLANRTESESKYFHQSFVFQNILQHSSSSPKITTIWDKQGEGELSKKFNELKSSTGKKNIILIDTGIKHTGKLQNTNFLIELYQNILIEDKYLPVLLSSDSHEDSFLINRLSEVSQGEIYLVKSENKALLNLIQNVSIVITDDLYVKSISDLGSKPSILLHSSAELPYSDFSLVEKSFLIQVDIISAGLVPTVSDLYHSLLENKSPQIVSDTRIYQTNIYHNLPVMIPLQIDHGDEAFAKWWLGVRYLSEREGLKIPMIKMNQDLYRKVIENERSNIKNGLSKFLALLKQGDQKEAAETKIIALEGEEGVLSLGVKFVRYINKNQEVESKKLLEQLRDLLKEMLDFLTQEEQA